MIIYRGEGERCFTWGTRRSRAAGRIDLQTGGEPVQVKQISHLGVFRSKTEDQGGLGMPLESWGICSKDFRGHPK